MCVFPGISREAYYMHPSPSSQWHCCCLGICLALRLSFVLVYRIVSIQILYSNLSWLPYHVSSMFASTHRSTIRTSCRCIVNDCCKLKTYCLYFAVQTASVLWHKNITIMRLLDKNEKLCYKNKKFLMYSIPVSITLQLLFNLLFSLLFCLRLIEISFKI